ncbi:MAG TPA: hypothetical protein VFN16_01345 [Saccharospirillum sp.]|nr:hypothetical protein [Saccharospirillum sp.]
MSHYTPSTQHQLIDGVFSPDDARSILMALIEHKIQFHERDGWSKKERLGKTDEHGARRIRQLQQTKADLADLIDAAGDSAERLAIRCTIEISQVSE